MLAKGVPCSMGCQGHVTHPCEKCGRLAAGTISLSATSPALKEQSGSYPARWNGRVPLRVRMLKTVRSDWVFGQALVAREGEVYDVWVNRHGAVSVILEEGMERQVKKLGVKPDEFEVVDWYDRQPS